MVEVIAPVLDGPGRAGRDAGPAGSAVAVERRVRLERHVREDRDQAEARAELRVDEKVVAPEPAEPGRPADVLVRDVGALPLPIDDLGGGDGKRGEASFLDAAGDEEGSPVQEGVRLPVVVEVERGRVVEDIVEDGAAQRFPERDGPSEPRPRRRLEEEILAQTRDVGDAEEVDSRDRGRRLSENPWTLPILSAPPGPCQTRRLRIGYS